MIYWSPENYDESIRRAEVITKTVLEFAKSDDDIICNVIYNLALEFDIAAELLRTLAEIIDIEMET